MSKPTTELAEVIRIERGAHDSFAAGNCAMELVAFMAHEEHSDHPVCASRVLGNFVRSINDAMDDDTRQKLAPYLIRLIGTVDTREQEQTRTYMLADWACRVAAPMALRARGFRAEADLLASLAPVVDKQTAAAAAADAAHAAHAAANADAADAAYAAYAAHAADAAHAAAADAAYVAHAADAAHAAANAAAAAAADAAHAAANADAANAAYAAHAAANAADAANDAHAALWDSALDLLDRLIAVTETNEPAVCAVPERVATIRKLGVPV